MNFYMGTDFTPYPSGRYYTDGDGSGEEFREEFLVKILKFLPENDVLSIYIDDEVDSYGSSFLVESFAGLIRYGYFNKDFVFNKIKFKYEDDSFKFFVDRINSYINEAEFESLIYSSTKEEAIRKGLYKGSIKKTFLIKNNIKDI